MLSVHPQGAELALVYMEASWLCIQCLFSCLLFKRLSVFSCACREQRAHYALRDKGGKKVHMKTKYRQEWPSWNMIIMNYVLKKKKKHQSKSLSARTCLDCTLKISFSILQLWHRRHQLSWLHFLIFLIFKWCIVRTDKTRLDTKCCRETKR